MHLFAASARGLVALTTKSNVLCGLAVFVRRPDTLTTISVAAGRSFRSPGGRSVFYFSPAL